MKHRAMRNPVLWYKQRLREMRARRQNRFGDVNRQPSHSPRIHRSGRSSWLADFRDPDFCVDCSLLAYALGYFYQPNFTLSLTDCLFAMIITLPTLALILFLSCLILPFVGLGYTSIHSASTTVQTVLKWGVTC